MANINCNRMPACLDQYDVFLRITEMPNEPTIQIFEAPKKVKKITFLKVNDNKTTAFRLRRHHNEINPIILLFID